MAMNIPNQLPTGLASFNQGFKGMADFMDQIKQHQLKQLQLQELMKYHQADIDLRKAAAGRAARAASLAERKEQPGYRVQKFLQEREMLRKALANRFPNMPGVNNGMSQDSGGQMPEEQPQEPSYGMGQGMMMPGGQMPAMGQDEQQAAASMAPQAQQPEESGYNQQPISQVDAYGIDWSNPIDAMAAQNAGFKAPAQTPQQKQAMELETDRIKQERAAKTAENKEKLKVKMTAEKDIPHLEASLKGVNELIKIAKSDPSLFGHYIKPDLWAKVTKNKNAGRWTSLMSDQIAGLESKLSSKGNIVALKAAQNMKPSFAEQQDVAIGKLEVMKSQLEDALNNSKQNAGRKTEEKNKNLDPLGLFGQ